MQSVLVYISRLEYMTQYRIETHADICRARGAADGIAAPSTKMKAISAPSE